MSKIRIYTGVLLLAVAQFPMHLRAQTASDCDSDYTVAVAECKVQQNQCLRGGANKW